MESEALGSTKLFILHVGEDGSSCFGVLERAHDY
jgi:hypothetical protein